jgi:transposase
VRFWAAIAAGVLTDEASETAGVSAPVGYRWFRHAGGVNPQLSTTVSGRYLSFPEREDIALLRAQGFGVRVIARRLGRDASTISRELRRNASTRTYDLVYKASTAQWHAERRARRPKLAKLVVNQRLRDYVQQRLAGEVRDAEGAVIGPDGPAWKGRNKPNRLDTVLLPLGVDELDLHRDGRSSSAAKKDAADFRIWFARRSSRTSRSNSAILVASVELVPAWLLHRSPHASPTSATPPGAHRAGRRSA